MQVMKGNGERTVSAFYAGMIYFTYLTDFCYFPLKIVFRKLLDMVGAGQKWTI